MMLNLITGFWNRTIVLRTWLLTIGVLFCGFQVCIHQFLWMKGLMLALVVLSALEYIQDYPSKPSPKAVAEAWVVGVVHWAVWCSLLMSALIPTQPIVFSIFALSRVLLSLLTTFADVFKDATHLHH